MEPLVCEGRVVCIPVRRAPFGVIACYSAYFQVGEGPGVSNTQMAGAIAEHAAGHGCPWLVVADWNMEPQ
eukprot:8216069-Lingulodinium_polyedra.AAC.1